MIEAGEKQSIGNLLKEWRVRRRLSQLDLAVEAEISTRHLSFLETGRAQPSREMVLRLAEQLNVPLRERNSLLVAAGYAPVYSEKTLDDPSFAAARTAVDLILKGHEPFPALAVDRHWTLVAANRAVAPLLAGIDESLLQPPINVFRLSLHPKGLAARIVNLAQWRAHLFSRLERQIDVSGDAGLKALLKELKSYPEINDFSSAEPDFERENNYVAIPFRLQTERGVLSFVTTTTIFGTPVDITLSELAIESFFPADAETTKVLNDILSE